MAISTFLQGDTQEYQSDSKATHGLDMTERFYVQPLLQNIFQERDLLDFGSPGGELS